MHLHNISYSIYVKGKARLRFSLPHEGVEKKQIEANIAFFQFFDVDNKQYQ